MCGFKQKCASFASWLEFLVHRIDGWRLGFGDPGLLWLISMPDVARAFGFEIALFSVFCRGVV